MLDLNEINQGKWIFNNQILCQVIRKNGGWIHFHVTNGNWEGVLDTDEERVGIKHPYLDTVWRRTVLDDWNIVDPREWSKDEQSAWYFIY